MGQNQTSINSCNLESWQRTGATSHGTNKILYE
jgi:hypothetical protein